MAGIDTKHIYIKKYILTDYYGKHLKVLKEKGSSFLKFYPNGKVSYFPLVGNIEYSELISNYEFKKNDFDPRKSFMGYYYYYYLKGEEINMLKVHLKECNAANLPSNITIKGDTLFVQAKRYGSRNYGIRVFVLSDIPLEFLEGWEPDW